MLATFISFRPFFWLGLENIGVIIACVGVAILCLGVAIACSDSPSAAYGWPLGIAFIVFAIFAPQQITSNHQHAPIARAQMVAAYGGKVISISLQDHKATMQPRGCSAPIQQEMRRFKGIGYRYALDVPMKDASGQSYTGHKPMSTKQVLVLCQDA